jgi:hypothetical protein
MRAPEESEFGKSARDIMAAIWDRAQDPAYAEAEADRTGAPIPLPPTWGKDTPEAFAKWSALSREDQKDFAKACAISEARKAEAAKFGLTAAEAEALMALHQAEQSAASNEGLAPVMQRVAALKPSQAPEVTLERLTEIAEFITQNPEEGYRWLGERLGIQAPALRAVDVEAWAKQTEAGMANATERAFQAAARTVFNEFAGQNPDVMRFVPAMNAALKSGAVRRSGNMQRDLAAAYEYARRAS